MSVSSTGNGSENSQIGPPPPFDLDLVTAFDEVYPRLPVLECLDDIPTARATETFAPMSDDDLSCNRTFRIERHVVPASSERPDITLLVCRHLGEQGPVPALYFVHGGGMYGGTIQTGLPQVLDWGRALGATVVCVDYRRAPESPHPGPVEDCYAGLTWVSENSAELGIDPARIVSVGISAGGGIAGGMTLLARDKGGPALAAQLLMCPMLDDRNDSYSSAQMAGAGVWTRQNNEVGWTALLGESRGTEDVPCYAAPARATNLAGLPPTFLDVGSAETFRDEVVDYADRIWRAGGQAELHVWSGGYHGYDALAPEAAISVDTRAARLAWLRRILRMP